MFKLNSLARGMIVVVGGSAAALERQCSDSVEITNQKEDFKLISPRLNEPRRSPILIPRNEKTVIVVGGCNEGVHLKTAEELDVESGQVYSANFCLPHGLSCAASCQTPNGTTFIFGGYDGVECLKTVMQIKDREIKELKPMSMRLKNSAAVCVSDDRILLFGGWDERATMNTVFSYNTDGTQEFYSLLPSPLEGHTANRLGDHVFIVGGFNSLEVVASITRYDLKTRLSEIVGKLEIPRENHASAVYEFEGHFYLLVIGGWDGRKSLANCESFRFFDSAPWIERVECPFKLNEPRNRPAAVVLS